MLKDMLTKVGCVSGCRLTVSHMAFMKTCNHLATYTLRCTHGIVYQNSGASTFEEGNIVEDQLYFESANGINDVLSPHQNPNDLSRFQNNSMTNVSPSTKCLHGDMVENSPSRICHHNAESLQASRKNMISIIHYIRGRL